LDLAKRHRKDGRPNLSVEIKLALRHWVDRHEIPHIHNSALATAISVLADRIEGISSRFQDMSDKTWLNDAITREVVRDRVQKLVRHALAPLSERVTIPKEVKEEADLILKLLKHAMPRPGYVAPKFWQQGTVIISDQGLAAILQDLGRDTGRKGRVNIETRPELVAWQKRDETAWADAVRANTPAAFKNYLERTEVKRYGTEARKRLAMLEKQGRRK